ncbi:MAG: GNAT family N-acetyltransferase [Clostridiales bacterium]|nr:GNAT family N-acetyltransferase [Clostridiales bacterium]
MKIEYRNIDGDEITRELFGGFIRRQVVNDCRRFVDGEWVIRPDPFIDDWSEEDYAELIVCLKNTVATGGIVRGAFIDGVLKGFTSVEAAPMGDNGEYRDLTSIHVSQDCRGNGIGRALFMAAKEFARSLGAKKLYISAHSAIESQSFYSAMGCVDAVWKCSEHVEKEPFDCQLECLV